MAVGLLQEFEGDLARYDELTAEVNLDNDPPVGLIIHTVGVVGDCIRVFDVWKSQEAWERFRDERLNPAIAAVTGDAGPPESQTVVYALHDLFPG